MRRLLLAAVLGLMSVGILSSCSFLPTPIYNDDEQVAAVQMKHIAAAIEKHDSAALKRLFSPRAREKAADLDTGLDYFLSEFPSGKVTWETGGTGMTGHVGNYKKTTLLFGNFAVSAGGKKFELYFAYISQSDYDHRDVGIYALGAVPPSESGYTASGDRKPFDAWAGKFVMNETDFLADGPAGVYIPEK